MNELEKRLLLAGDASAAIDSASASSVAVVTSKTVVFVAPDIGDSSELMNSVPDDAELVILNPDTPLLSQISDELDGRSDIRQIHVVTHGSPGKLHLGNQVVDATALDQQALLLKEIAKSCAEGGDLMLYGCDVSGNQDGQSFIRKWANLTGLDVAASSNKTGSGLRGGDWILETEQGSVESQIVFDKAACQAFDQLLNITVNAAGSTGQELAQLLVDDAVVAQWAVDVDATPFVYETDQSLQANQVKIRFINDLYLPDEGIDRNLTVTSVQIDDQTFQTNAASTYSTGVWRPGQGITPGFGLGQTLHSNGVFQYAANESLGPLGDIHFEGRVWNTNPGTTVSVTDALNVSADGSAAAGVVWSAVDVIEGDQLRLGVTGSILSVDNQIFQDQTAAGVGIDFFNAEGIEVGEAVYELRAISGPFSSVVVDAPEGTAYGTVFIWVKDNPDGDNALTRVINLQVNQEVEPEDSTPPAVEFLSDGQTVISANQPVELLVRFTDESEVIAQEVTLFITDPSGSQREASGFFENSESLTNRTARVSFEPEPFAPEISQASNGVYTVSVRGGFVGAVRDGAGNEIEDQQIGTFTIGVPAPNDMTPPEILLEARPTQSMNGFDAPGFTVRASDSESPLMLGDLEKAVRVTGPNGYDRPALLAIAYDEPDLRAIYIIDLAGATPIVPGEYFISIDGAAFRDSAGNAPASGVIGSVTLIA